MPEFSIKSFQKLETCDQRLQQLFMEVVKHFNCTILEGHRGEKEQNEAFAKGNSKLKWPNGKHNRKPSNAVDVAPYPIDWEDRERMTYFAGFVRGVGLMMGIPVRWGGDWAGSTDLKANKFDDLVHFELSNE